MNELSADSLEWLMYVCFQLTNSPIYFSTIWCCMGGVLHEYHKPVASCINWPNYSLLLDFFFPHCCNRSDTCLCNYSNLSTVLPDFNFGTQFMLCHLPELWYCKLCWYASEHQKFMATQWFIKHRVAAVWKRGVQGSSEKISLTQPLTVWDLQLL